MGRLLRTALVVMLATAACGTASAGESFRCGSKLIAVGMTQGEVLEYCGEPASRSVEQQDVRSGNRVVGTTSLHRWTYESYSATRVLLFDEERLVSID